MVDKVETPVEAIKKEADMLQAMVWRPKLRFWSNVTCGFEKQNHPMAWLYGVKHT